MALSGLSESQKKELAEKLVYLAKSDQDLKQQLNNSINLYQRTGGPLKLTARDNTYKTEIMRLPEADLKQYIEIANQPTDVSTKPPNKSFMNRMLNLPSQAIRVVQKQITPQQQQQIIKKKEGKSEAVTQQSTNYKISNKLGAKQSHQEEESKMPKGSIYNDQLDVSLMGSPKSVKSIKSVKSSKSEKQSKSHQLLMEITNDRTLNDLIPQMAKANQLQQKGIITEKKALEMKSQAINENMSNKVVKALVMDIIDEEIKSNRNSQKSLQQQAPQTINDQKAFNDYYLHYQKSIRSKRSLYGQTPQVIDDQDVYKNDEGNYLGGQAQEIPKPVIGPVFIQAKERNTDVDQYLDILDRLSSKHGGAVSEKAQSLKDSYKRSQISTAIALAQIGQPHVSQISQPASEQVVSGMSANPNLAPKVHTIVDFLEMSQYGAWIDDLIQKSDLTDEQSELARRTLHDVDSVNNLVSQQLLDVGYGTDDQIEISSEKGSRVSKQTNSPLFDVGSHKVSEKVIKETMKKTVDQISKLIGDLPTIATVDTFKTQTEVFTTKVKKKESNQFAVKQGSAFRLRQCQ